MKKLISLLDALPLFHITLIALMLGLAPFRPMPHLFEKLGMLGQGRLTQPVDIFDLFMHGLPVLLLVAKLARIAYLRRG